MKKSKTTIRNTNSNVMMNTTQKKDRKRIIQVNFNNYKQYTVDDKGMYPCPSNSSDQYHKYRFIKMLRSEEYYINEQIILSEDHRRENKYLLA